ncbi:FHA domain-containing protein [Pseudomonas sp. NPDC090233]|uniref:FHA domain-containing protein n=1 Tax=Pseudomonas sp. NPDC090233 TaxID=3364479 RepID=UPI00383AB50D
MSTHVFSPSITLSVLNPEILLHGNEPLRCFDRAGGSIGSQGTWLLNDRKAGILPVHCEVGWHEGYFCIVDHSGKSFMNGSDTALPSDTPIRLKHNDRLQVGDYHIAIRLFSMDEQRPEHSGATNPLSALQGTQQVCPLQVLGKPVTDIVNVHRTPMLEPDERDPLAYLDRAAHARVDPAIAEIFGEEAR